MPEFTHALTLALLPAAGNFAGGLLAEWLPLSQRRLSLALHAATGVLLAVIAVELMPEAITVEPAWAVVAAFVLGGAAFLGVDAGVGIVRARMGRNGSGAAWPIVAAVSVDLFADGVIIGTGATIASSLALLLALGQVPADVPEGFATMASLREQGTPRRHRLAIAAAFTIPILAGTTIGYWALREQPEWIKFLVLAFMAGVLLTIVVEEIIPEAHEDGESRLAALMLLGGFGLFTLLSAYFD